MGGTKLTHGEMSACALLLTLSSQVVSEQCTAMVKQNGFQVFSAPVFHTEKLLQLFVGVCVFTGLNFPQEVQNALRFSSVSCCSGSSCTLEHLTGFRLCRHEWYAVIWYPNWITSYCIDIILELEVSWCSRLENTFYSRQIAGPMYAASWAARSATGWLRSILQSPCHRLWDIMALQQNFRQLRAVVTFILAIHSWMLMLQIHGLA